MAKWTNEDNEILNKHIEVANLSLTERLIKAAAELQRPLENVRAHYYRIRQCAIIRERQRYKNLHLIKI